MLPILVFVALAFIPVASQNEDSQTTDEIAKSMKRAKSPGAYEVIKTAGEPMIQMLKKIIKQV